MTDGQPLRARQSILHLQRTYGNRYVQRVLDLARQGEGEGEVTPEVESVIERSRGGGQALEMGVRRQMELAFGADFSGVRIHTGGESHSLNRAVNAMAFTTGQDIFFRDGTYNPESSGGKELLAHELTHVVQQSGSGVVQGKLVLGDLNNEYEQEADHTAKSVIGALDPPLASLANRNPPMRRCSSGERMRAGGCMHSTGKEEGNADNLTQASSITSVQRQDDGDQNYTPGDQGGGMTVNPLAKTRNWGLSPGITGSVALGVGAIYMLLGLKNLDTGCYSTLRFTGAGLGLEEHALTLACGTEYSEFTTSDPVDFSAFNGWGSIKIIGGGIGIGGSAALASFQGIDTDPGQINIGGCEVGIPDIGGGLFEGRFAALSIRLPDGSSAGI